MSVNVTLLVIMGVLVAAGIYLLTERSLTRVLLGIILLGNGVNLLILATGGVPGLAPIFDEDTDPSEYSDPLPQALILTSIVITFAMTAFMLGMIYRSWWLSRRDEVQVDPEDVRVRQNVRRDMEGGSE
jgi:multicomponent Na+:H+ antiporter subunit C